MQRPPGEGFHSPVMDWKTIVGVAYPKEWLGDKKLPYKSQG